MCFVEDLLGAAVSLETLLKIMLLGSAIDLRCILDETTYLRFTVGTEADPHTIVPDGETTAETATRGLLV